MPTAAGTHSSATAQKVARHPIAVPSSAPAGTPATTAIVVPERRAAKARPFWFGATRPVAVVRATARKPALATAARTRVANSTEKDGVVAATTWQRVKITTNPRSVVRAGHRRAKAAMRGEPTIIPTAKAEVSSPADPTETSRLVAMSGTRPASMNSEVPMAKTARASRWRAKGIELLRGMKRTEGVSSPRPTRGSNNRPHACGSGREAGTSVVQGLTAWPKAPEVSDSGLDMDATLPMAARLPHIHFR